MSPPLRADDDIFTDNRRWADVDEWNRSAVALHERGGIHRVEAEGFTPFWAVVDHQGVLEVERRPELFTNQPRPGLRSDAEFEERQSDSMTLLSMDGPEHTEYRKLTSDWFKPASVKRLDDRLAQLSAEAVETLEASGGQCDFATEIAQPYPLQVILEVLGMPREDFGRMQAWTYQLFFPDDPDLQPEPLSEEARQRIRGEVFAYFSDLTAQRRTTPTGDLASVISNGLIGGQPLPDHETLSYYLVIATAGHETTSSAMAGGMHALVDHPEQLARLKTDPELMTNAVEEILRWTAPVRHFMRTAQEDTELLGHEIKAGDWVYLSYKAANLDPKVFDDPLRFDIGRANAANHLSFGFGAHFCLGAQLARDELRSLFGHVLPRLESVELAGDPALMKTTFVGGYK
ncbi:MAG: cytochrome P450, partial [Actinomycetota bacterium]